MAVPAAQKRLANSDQLGEREGACHLGWPHEFDPVNCELDNVCEEDVHNAPETHHEVLSHMRDNIHRQHSVPTRWELLRMAAAGTPHELHGAKVPGIERYNIPAEVPAEKAK